MTVFLLSCRNYTFFISFWLLFPSFWFPLWGLPQIAWKSTKSLPPVSALKEDVEIREVLEEILKNYAENPGRVRLHPQIQGKVSGIQLKGRTMDGIFGLLLEAHGLSLMEDNKGLLIVPMKLLWKHQIYQKPVRDPLPLEQVLLEISSKGKITIRFNREKLKDQKLLRTLAPQSVGMALEELAFRKQAHLVYHSENHVLEWFQPDEMLQRFIFLENVSSTQLESAIKELHPNLNLKRVKLSFPGADTVLLKGPKQDLELAEELIRHLDRSEGSSDMKSDSKFIRLQLRYLHVGSRVIRRNGRLEEIQGVKSRLLDMIENLDESDPLLPVRSLKILADQERNVLILQGSRKQLRLLKKVIELWDQPVPQIKIEAHIFETNESDALKLGMEFSGRGKSEDGTLTADPGESYAFGLTLGSQETSQSMRIDAILRFLQSKGRGRILSRPLVVTANNIEAEMNSGSVINVRLSGEKTASLQEIKTGVTLRVTPRLIPNPGDNRSQDQILLKVYAETSSPMAGINVDGIPQINSQHASTEVTVLQGEPYLVSGLIKDRESMNQSGIPLLQDLPLIGWLFRSEGSTSALDHVLVFVTPTRLEPFSKQRLPDMNRFQESSEISVEQ